MLREARVEGEELPLKLVVGHGDAEMRQPACRATTPSVMSRHDTLAKPAAQLHWKSTGPTGAPQTSPCAVGFGRIVALEIEAPNMSVHLVQSG